MWATHTLSIVLRITGVLYVIHTKILSLELGVIGGFNYPGPLLDVEFEFAAVYQVRLDWLPFGLDSAQPAELPQ